MDGFTEAMNVDLRNYGYQLLSLSKQLLSILHGKTMKNSLGILSWIPRIPDIAIALVPGSRANFTLHSAFKDPSSPQDGEDRVSCEAESVPKFRSSEATFGSVSS